MSNITNIKDFKKSKKAKKIVEDLEQAIKIHNLTISGLKFFSKYSIVMESISVLQGNKTLLEIHLKKYKSMIDSKK